MIYGTSIERHRMPASKLGSQSLQQCCVPHLQSKILLVSTEVAGQKNFRSQNLGSLLFGGVALGATPQRIQTDHE